MVRTLAHRQVLWDTVAGVVDPEIPALTIADLGVLRAVEVTDDGTVVVTITPTYSGCPAMDAITEDIGHALQAAGVTDYEIELVLAPAWTTDWLSDQAREKLATEGIAPPMVGGGDAAERPVCPHCGSAATQVISPFGSTACQALWVCGECREPFPHFKAH